MFLQEMLARFYTVFKDAALLFCLLKAGRFLQLIAYYAQHYGLILDFDVSDQINFGQLRTWFKIYDS